MTYQAIGFAEIFYTLWEISISPTYFSDAYGNHHQTGSKEQYRYIKNISMDLETAKSLYPNLRVDEGLRGRTSSYTKTVVLPDTTPHILKFGKYCGQIVSEVFAKDPSYIFWVLDNHCTPELRAYIEGLPEVVAHMSKEREQKQKSENGFLAEINRIKESGIIQFQATRNLSVHNGDGYLVHSIGKQIYLWFKNVSIMEYNGHQYGLPYLGTTAKRIKNKEIIVKVISEKNSPKYNGVGEVCGVDDYGFIVELIKVIP